MRTGDDLKILAETGNSNVSLLLAQEEFNGEWERLASLPKQDYSGVRISSKNLSDFDPKIFLARESNGAHRPSRSIQFYDIGQSEDYLSSKFYEKEIEINNIRSNSGTNTVGLKYIYEKDEASQEGIDFSYHFGKPEDELHIAYQNRSIAENSPEWINKVVPHSEGTKEENELRISASPDLHQSDQGRIVELLETSTHDKPFTMGAVLTDKNLFPPALDFESTTISPYSINSFSMINYAYIPEKLPTSKRKTKQNYAIVVGIDEYKDRMSLHTCANDAKSVADLMGALGYNVILLSDQTKEKPTKRNILDVALKDIKHELDLGNVIFYFSGHGTRAYDDTFYLIPQDANGSTSSYISEYEIKQQIKDIKNLAVIIDACDSEGLSPAIGKGQLIMASSKDNEPSNEEWTGSLSVFTSNLIKAIKEESIRNKKILLQKCFFSAYNDTIKWSHGRFVSQTPVLTDLTGGKYYIN